jgi:hypothetical protein
VGQRGLFTRLLGSPREVQPLARPGRDALPGSHQAASGAPFFQFVLSVSQQERSTCFFSKNRNEI